MNEELRNVATPATRPRICITVPKNIQETPPTRSSKTLPVLPDHVIAGLRDHSLQFKINAEPCALQLSPTGRLLAVACTDGTVRLFDLTGRYKPSLLSYNNKKKGTHCCSFTHQQFGAVAVQLEAKGVHRSLLLQVDVSPDAQWFFAGALRGSMELAAISVGDLEAALSRPSPAEPGNLLDLVKVYTHSDAKLRGLEACTCLPTTPSQYLLLTGRGIKNCHVWRFVPPTSTRPYPLFEAILNLPTNGTTIKFLHFQETPYLQAVTKSDDMKVQVWDLRDVQTQLHSDTPLTTPLPRPSVQDVPLTESALGVAGSVCLCGGSEHLFNTLSVVHLEDRLCHELALPGTATQRRRSRGDLQSVASVATLYNDADHALLQLADDSLVWFQLSHVHPTLLPMTAPGFVEKVEKRKVQIRRVGYQGMTMAVSATFDCHRGAGKIQFQILEEEKSHEGRFWGYLGTSLGVAPEESPVPVQETVDLKSFATTEVDDDNGSSGSDSFKVLSKVPSVTPSLSTLGKQSIVTPQVSGLKFALTTNSGLRPLARKLTQTLPFVSAKKTKKNIGEALLKNENEKRAGQGDSSGVPRKKKKARVETAMLEDLAAASILKSIGQGQRDFSSVMRSEDPVSAQKRRPLTSPEPQASSDQTSEALKLELSKKSTTSHSAGIVGKRNESAFHSSMSPPVPRKKASSQPSDTISPKTKDQNSMESAAKQVSPKPVSARTMVKVDSIPILNTPASPRPVNQAMTDTSLASRRAAKLHNVTPSDTQPDSKAPCQKLKKNGISKRCAKYIETLQIELDKLGPHQSRLLLATESDRMSEERQALQKFAVKRALRMVIAVLKSVQLQPTRLAWMEAKTFVEESLKDLNLAWVSCCL
jgi:WD40 repeat protein